METRLSKTIYKKSNSQGDNMITQREILNFLKENMNKPFSETSFRKYVYELMKVLDSKDLKILLEKEGLPGIQVKAYMLLLEREKIERDRGSP